MAGHIVIRSWRGLVVRLLTRFLLFRVHRIRIQGAEHMARIASGEPLVLITNHSSYLDGLLLCSLLPPTIYGTINSQAIKTGFGRFMYREYRGFHLDPQSPLSIRDLVRAVRGGGTCFIFPEGRLTRTGGLMKAYPGAGVVAEQAGALILPAWVEGPQFTRASQLGGRVRRRNFPPFRVCFAAPRRLELPDGLRGRARRDAMARAIEDMMAETMAEATKRDLPLFAGLAAIRALALKPADSAVEDGTFQTISFSALIEQAARLADGMRLWGTPGEVVGLRMHGSIACVTALFGLFAAGRTVLVLDPAWTADQVMRACRLTGCTRLLDDGDGLADGLAALTPDLDMRPAAHMARPPGFASARRRKRLPGLSVHPGAAALIFPTFAADGALEGVVHTHSGIQTARARMAARSEMAPGDAACVIAPLHRAEALLTGLLLPLLSGARAVLPPEDMAPASLPDMLYLRRPTTIFATCADLADVAEHAHPYDLTFARQIHCLDGPPPRDLSRIWMEKLGQRLFPVLIPPGFGMPVAMNTPLWFRMDSVGRLLPGIGVTGGEDGTVRLGGSNLAVTILREGGVPRENLPRLPSLTVQADGFLTPVQPKDAG